jgi:DNA-binding NtrC family response regulator|uniref:Sigma-54-dependent Fis family transcriptional regulator n=1 Tax=candidate division WOR-3 bacterium TaxID=2052148 RepID=A0A7V3VUD8_UNCW3
MKPKILLLDDEESLLKWLSYALEENGFEVFATTEPRSALNQLKEVKFDCVISDIRMPGMDGFQFLRNVRKIYPTLPVIFITAYGSMESVINALRDGASDYILKPFGIDEILNRIRANLRKDREISNEIIGESRVMKNVLNLVDKIAQTDATVLILGESGTGKELIAREIHRRSKRASFNFVTLSCAALPETLLESELFGYKKGAFTGATTDKDGLFLAANKGSFFLDEIGDAPPSIQMKLLRLLEEREIVPLGSTKPIKVDVRLIAATNKDLYEEVKNNRFREDLYYRLNVIPITLPPLRQRKEDIPLLAEYFLKSICERENLGEKKLLKSTIEILKNYNWPGNVRELKHIIERAAVLSDTYYIKPEHISLPQRGCKTLKEIEQEEIERVLKECGGNISKAAKLLGIDRKTLYNRLKKK